MIQIANVGRICRGLFENSILIFSWRQRVKPQKRSVRRAGVRQGVKMEPPEYITGS